jgi:hypothetical protein
VKKSMLTIAVQPEPDDAAAAAEPDEVALGVVLRQSPSCVTAAAVLAVAVMAAACTI